MYSYFYSPRALNQRLKTAVYTHHTPMCLVFDCSWRKIHSIKVAFSLLLKLAEQACVPPKLLRAGCRHVLSAFNPHPIVKIRFMYKVIKTLTTEEQDTVATVCFLIYETARWIYLATVQP